MEDKTKLKNEILNLLEEVNDYCKYSSIYDQDIIECLFQIKDKMTPFIQSDRKSLKVASALKGEAKASSKNSEIENYNYLSRRYGYKSLNKHERLSSDKEDEDRETEEECLLGDTLQTAEKADDLMENINSLILSTDEMERTLVEGGNQGKGEAHVPFESDACFDKLNEIGDDELRESESEETLCRRYKFHPMKSDSAEESDDGAKSDNFRLMQVNDAPNQDKIKRSDEIEVKLVEAPLTNQYHGGQISAVQMSKIVPTANAFYKLKPIDMDAFPLVSWQNVVEELEQELKKKRNSLESNFEVESSTIIPSVDTKTIKGNNYHEVSIIPKSLPISFAESVVEKLKAIFKMKKGDKDNECTLKDEVLAAQTDEVKINILKKGGTEIVAGKILNKPDPLKDAFWYVLQELGKKLKERQEVELRHGTLSVSNNMPGVRLSVHDVLKSLEKDDSN